MYVCMYTYIFYGYFVLISPSIRMYVIRMYVCMYVCIYVCTHHEHVQRLDRLTYMHVCMHAYIHTYVPTSTNSGSIALKRLGPLRDPEIGFTNTSTRPDRGRSEKAIALTAAANVSGCSSLAKSVNSYVLYWESPLASGVVSTCTVTRSFGSKAMLARRMLCACSLRSRCIGLGNVHHLTWRLVGPTTAVHLCTCPMPTRQNRQLHSRRSSACATISTEATGWASRIAPFTICVPALRGALYCAMPRRLGHPRISSKYELQIHPVPPRGNHLKYHFFRFFV